MKILYICTHNRCRSVLCEAITNHIAGGHIVAKSAGSQPAGEVHPGSLQVLRNNGISTEGLASKSWDELESFAPDLVVTVCDSAAGESCPIWFGNSVKVHWGLEDPSKMESGEARDRAFQQTVETIRRRVRTLMDRSVDSLKGDDLRHAMSELGASA